eukprot:6211732-Pyramimonas_sp.AAC.1
MATPTRVDAMRRVAMMVTTAAMTTAMTIAMPMLITPADDDDDVFALAVQVFEGVRLAREADAH